MSFSLNYFSAALFVSAIISGIMAVISYRRRAVIGANTLMWLMIALTFWSTVYAIENLNPGLGWHKFWSGAQYLSIASIPVLWLVFAIQYSQQEKAPSLRKLSWLGILPVLTIIMAWTNDLHGLVWPRMELVTLQGITLLSVEHGIYFWVQAIYAYLTIFAGTIIFVRQTMRASDMYRSQAFIMLLAAAFLLLGNGLYVFGLLPFKGLDITPFTFTISSLILAWGLFRHRLLDLMPIASEIVLGSLGDGIMVTDASARIAYINPALEALAGLMPGTSVGHPVSEVLYNWPNIFREYKQSTMTEIELGTGAQKIFLEVQISPLFKQQTYIGCIYDLRNITERVDTESKMRLLRQSITKELPGEYTPILIAFRAKDGKILDINNEYVFHTGYNRDESIGRTALQLGLWDVETRTILTRQMHEKSLLTDAVITVKTKSGQNQTWKLSISTTSMDSDELHIWTAKPDDTPR
jgi:PAS domain S-box-containing protein